MWMFPTPQVYPKQIQRGCILLDVWGILYPWDYRMYMSSTYEFDEVALDVPFISSGQIESRSSKAPLVDWMRQHWAYGRQVLFLNNCLRVSNTMYMRLSFGDVAAWDFRERVHELLLEHGCEEAIWEGCLE